ncbi:uncharacterized protein PV07_12719 [Cladophialophora immunda]|uniref:Uncharacterized protein n=1 Tax=Cladophialophora immunda TaxID=569365 RepID=A0A0D2CE83_9EURO|nr:uncharacterized protein PV07_12719 [Cladophialophora immunda]KIW21864.1 hypothetical protein PV07_12719 [Cladophialophora immunda]
MGTPLHEKASLAIVADFIKRDDMDGLKEYKHGRLSSQRNSYQMAKNAIELDAEIDVSSCQHSSKAFGPLLEEIYDLMARIQSPNPIQSPVQGSLQNPVVDDAQFHATTQRLQASVDTAIHITRGTGLRGQHYVDGAVAALNAHLATGGLEQVRAPIVKDDGMHGVLTGLSLMP